MSVIRKFGRHNSRKQYHTGNDRHGEHFLAVLRKSNNMKTGEQCKDYARNQNANIKNRCDTQSTSSQIVRSN